MVVLLIFVKFSYQFVTLWSNFQLLSGFHAQISSWFINQVDFEDFELAALRVSSS